MTHSLDDETGQAGAGKGRKLVFFEKEDWAWLGGRLFVLIGRLAALFQLKKWICSQVTALYFIMGKRPKRCPKKCEKHRFILKPVHYSAVFSRELQACFCPTGKLNLSITPTFNKDKHHFTTSFLLPLDHPKLITQEQTHRQEHEQYKMENINEKSEMLVPKPKTKYSYCSVCRDDYEDYLQHIRSEKHKLLIKENQFDSFIDQLCQSMKLKNHTVVAEDLDDRFPESVDNKCSFASQESLSCDPQCSLKSTPSFSTGAEYKQISDWLHCCKTFQLLPDLNDQNNMVLPEEQFAFPMHLSFSPVKHACEVPEGRQVANLTPIILSRGVKPLKSHL